MLTIILTICVFLLAFSNLYLNKNDLFAPPTLVSAVYLVSCIFLITEMFKWDGEISIYTLYVILLGLVIYSIVGDIVALSFQNRTKNIRDINTKGSIIRISHKAIFIIIIFEAIVGVSYFRDVKSLAEQLKTYDSLAEMISTYRNSISFEGSHIVGTISRFSRHGLNLSIAIAYVLIFVLIKNRFEKCQTSINMSVLTLAAIIIPGGISLLGGGRNTVLGLVLATITIYYIFRNVNYKRIKFKNYRNLLLIILAIVLVFLLMGRLIGRTRESNIYDYIAIYVGAPIKLFDMFLQNPDNTVKIVPGQETFINLWKYIGRMIGNDKIQNLVMNKEFRSVNGYSLGNVYTAFREYYSDFGIVGVVVLTTIHSLFYSYYYNHIKYKTNYNKKPMNAGIIIYAYFSQALYYFSIDDRFYQALISTQTIEILFYIILICHFINSLNVPRTTHLNYKYKNNNNIIKYSDNI